MKNTEARSAQTLPSGLAEENELRYSSTLMYGKYTNDLGRYARCLSRDRQTQRSRKSEGILQLGQTIRNHIRFHLGDQWLLMIILGLSIALISYVMDGLTSFLHTTRLKLLKLTPDLGPLKYLSWITLPVLLVTFASGFVQLVSPHAIGSGFAEIRCILRGVILHRYLDVRTLLAKLVALTAVLGAGMPLGKEGPFVHIACILSNLYSKGCASKNTSPRSRSYSLDLLAAAAAVGVGACFASPVGGVLLSIEATAPYFAVRNYWRGFLGAASGTLLYLLIAVWYSGKDSLEALYSTNFSGDVPYRSLELILFGFIGLLCGLLGALFVYILKVYILWMKSSMIRKYLLKIRLFYSVTISLIITTLQYPNGMGLYTAGYLNTEQHFEHLFSNFTWTKQNLDQRESSIVRHWNSPSFTPIGHLAIFFTFSYTSSILASTLPVPSGMFIPLFKTGAALSRLIGESTQLYFPRHLRFAINPGGYAVVGAAAFSGAVTQTVSTCVIVLEVTGQLRYMLPIIVAAMISNIVARKLHPSLYDMLTIVKQLPTLPDIPPISKGGAANDLLVRDFMESKVEYIWRGIMYRELVNLLEKYPQYQSFPIVDDLGSLRLLGSVKRIQLKNWMDTSAKLPEEQIDLQGLPIDSVRIQLSLNDSIEDVHCLFHLMRIDLAFVTERTRLVGFVGLSELKMAIDGIHEDTCHQAELGGSMNANQRVLQGSSLVSSSGSVRSQLDVEGLNGQSNKENELAQYGNDEDHCKEVCAIACTTAFFSEVV